ncbi:sulfatase-like hydrolase/transferase [Halomarina pelagica]|uniref:sulfatase-like hydrolase/transferase n=1 Tax=Halomarina pelagica TaxID=2961599 RepID=UPI0020C4D9AF|nr:sulfatase-like hydrolase/transferase [Halomarina sp. BND7]
MPGLSKFSGRDTVENVVVFISDSLRYDALPTDVAERGVAGRTIAASTYTATSVPSMMTGLYPARHCVWNFNDVLAETPPLLAGERAGTDLRTIWDNVSDPAQKPPNRVLRIRGERTVEGSEPPFTVVVHDHGGHAPYDLPDDDWSTSPAFFERYGDDPDRLVELYHAGVETSAERFRRLVEDLEDRALLEETLVVFTSDHGELLGEPERGGVWGHGAPVCPELVEVPTVFVGAGLPAGERIDTLLSGTDLAPTALGALGEDVPADRDGLDLWNATPPEYRVVRSDFWANAGRIRYGACSAWDADGGLVRNVEGPQERLAFAAHRKWLKGAQAPANRRGPLRQYLNLLRIFGEREHVYGEPHLLRVREELVEGFETKQREADVERISTDQLRALGYVE